MRTVSDRFLATLRISHVVVAEADLFLPDDLTTPLPLELEGGTVTIDRTALIRRTGSIETPWSPRTADLFGVDLADLPYGGRVALRRGVRYGDGSTELVDLGLFRVESVGWTSRAGVSRLELADLMAQVRDEPFLAPFTPGEATGVTLTGTLTDGSAVVTGLADTSSLLPGMAVGGLGIPAGTTVATVDSSSQVTLSAAVTLTRTKTVNGLPNNAVLTGISDTSDLTVGMSVDPSLNVDGDNMVQAGTLIQAIDSSSQITLSKPTANVTFRGPGKPGGVADFTFRAPAVQSLTFGGGDRLADVAVAMVEDVFGPGGVTVIRLLDPAVLATDIYFTQNRAQSVVDLARSVAGDAYFDADGAFVFGPSPTLDGDPVWSVDAGEAGVLVDAGEGLERQGAYNGVLVRGQAAASSAPFSVLVVDDQPGSPTLWGGPFGKVARVEERTTSVQTEEQATDVANALLDDGLGLTRTLTLTAAPNPALEAGDVVLVTFDDGRVERHLLDTVRIGLAASSAQELATRVVDATVPAGLPAAGPLELELGPLGAPPVRVRGRRRVFTGAELAAELCRGGWRRRRSRGRP